MISWISGLTLRKQKLIEKQTRLEFTGYKEERWLKEAEEDRSTKNLHKSTELEGNENS
jgi:hypothetical protein